MNISFKIPTLVVWLVLLPAGIVSLFLSFLGALWIAGMFRVSGL